MKTLIATLIATAAGASIAAAPATAQNRDAYRTAMDKIAADYRAAKAKCDNMTKGDAEEICEEEAKLMRARAEADAVSKYDNTGDNLRNARMKVIEAEYEVADEKCETLRGDAEDKCEDEAKAKRTAALDAMRGDRSTAMGASGSAGMVASTDTRDAVKSAAVEKCEKMSGEARTACLVENRGTAAAAPTTLGERTREAIANVKEKASNAMDRTARSATDTTITSKVKASLVADADLKATDINVDTEKGVVMLSGFVESKGEAEKAERVAKGVEGVTKVKNSLKVK